MDSNPHMARKTLQDVEKMPFSNSLYSNTKMFQVNEQAKQVQGSVF